MTTTRDVIVGGIYRHWKGPRYLVIGVATDSNNTAPRSEPQVVYVSIDSDGRTSWPMHTRDVSEFAARFSMIEPVASGGGAADNEGSQP